MQCTNPTHFSLGGAAAIGFLQFSQRGKLGRQNRNPFESKVKSISANENFSYFPSFRPCKQGNLSALLLLLLLLGPISLRPSHSSRRLSALLQLTEEGWAVGGKIFRSQNETRQWGSFASASMGGRPPGAAEPPLRQTPEEKRGGNAGRQGPPARHASALAASTTKSSFCGRYTTSARGGVEGSPFAPFRVSHSPS